MQSVRGFGAEGGSRCEKIAEKKVTGSAGLHSYQVSLIIK